MSGPVSTAARHLMAAGVHGDALVEALAEIEASCARPVDDAAERRRAKDRERKREARERLRKSAESADNADNKKRVSPTPPSEKNTPPCSKEKTPKGVQKKGSSPQPVDDAVEDWNALAEELGLTRCIKITAARRTAISARLKDAGGLEGWRHALRRIRGSPFCRGNNDRGWKADIDWLATEKGFTRLIEGKYDDDGRTGQQRGGSIALLERRRAQRAANGG